MLPLKFMVEGKSREPFIREGSMVAIDRGDRELSREAVCNPDRFRLHDKICGQIRMIYQ